MELKAITGSKFCHECGCSLQAPLEEKDTASNKIAIEAQPANKDEVQNDFFAHFAEAAQTERDQNNQMLQKAEAFFLNYQITAAKPVLGKLADQGNLQAMYMIGLILEGGYGDEEKDISKAVDLFAELSNEGELLSSIHLLSFYVDEETKKDLVSTVNKNIMAGLDELEQSSSALVQYEVANYYACNYSVKMNHNKALAYYQKSAQQGYWMSLTALGNIYLSGNNCRPDVDKAIRYYKEAGLKGDKEALYMLGNIYYTGSVVQRDIQAAKHWYLLAAKQNYSDSLNMLAKVFLEEKDHFNAMRTYEKDIQMNRSSQSASELAYLYLGFHEEIYPDFPEDLAKGFALMKKALEFDDKSADAMFGLGICYHAGRGVEQDYNSAEKYYKQACRFGNDDIKAAAKDFLNTLHDNKKSNSEGCFITTAVCTSFHKTDYCYELTMFRNFRDTWLQKQQDGSDLITEYYRIAPGIVKHIDSLANAKEIYHSIWYTYLQPCLACLERGEYQQCKAVYISMVKELQKKL